jgi:hypothetical protein
VQVIDTEAGTLQNLGPLQLLTQATCEALSGERTSITISGARLGAGPLGLPLGIKGDRQPC